MAEFTADAGIRLPDTADDRSSSSVRNMQLPPANSSDTFFTTYKEPSLKILLVYPQYPDTFWSFKYALRFISKKAASPPLGLLTVAAMLPDEWQKKLVDMNTTVLRDEDVKWADYVFISAMDVQRDSVREIV